MSLSHSFQQTFLEQLARGEQTRELFDDLPGLGFFMKDRLGNLIAGNPYFLHRLQLKSETDLVGRRDEEFHPPAIARRFREDDRQVMDTGEALTNRLEPFLCLEEGFQWFVTNKRPLRTPEGKAIGVMGTTRPYVLGERSLNRSRRVDRVIAYILRNFAGPIRVDDIAGQLGITTRQLNHGFQEEVHLSVRAFISATRVHAAANRILRTGAGESLGLIALETGFADQSAMTRMFKSHLGCSPGKIRTQYGSGS